MAAKIIGIVIAIVIYISRGAVVGIDSLKADALRASISTNYSQPANAEPLAFYSADFERLLCAALGKDGGESVYAHELESITCINISDDLMTFEGRIHDRLNTPQTVTDISLRDTLFFPNLNTLYICDIVVHDTDILPALPSLRKLSLIGCSLDSCDVFADMRKLTYLSLAWNSIHSLEPLSGLTQLTSLDIASNPITTLEPLKTLVHLTDLCCAGNQIGDISVVRYMPDLRKVWFQSCDITSLEPLRCLSKLESAELSFIPNVTLSLEPLQGLERLEFVNLMLTKVDDLAYLSHVCTVMGGDEMGPPAHVVDDFGIEENEDGALTITDYLGSEPHLTLPAMLDGKPVTRIGEAAFKSSDTLVSVKIPDGVSVIEANAFSCCPLESVSFPDGLMKIGNYAFWGCSYLTSITLPSGLQEIGRHAFDECGLTSVEIPESVRELSGKSFEAGTMVIPATNHPLYEDAGDFLLNRETHELVVYMGDPKAQEITVPQGVTRIGLDAFCDCKALLSIVIPSSVTSIGGNAFTYCTSLSQVEISEGLTDIEYYAFSWCPSLDRLQLPESLERIDSFVFFECTGLKEIVMPGSMSRLGNNAFERCTSLTRITLPQGLSRIEDMTFDGCTSLVEIIIPSSVSSIHPMAFIHCGPSISETEVAVMRTQGLEPQKLKFIVESGSFAESWLMKMGYGNIVIQGLTKDGVVARRRNVTRFEAGTSQ